jgi:hypothetical protein
MPARSSGRTGGDAATAEAPTPSGPARLSGLSAACAAVAAIAAIVSPSVSVASVYRAVISASFVCRPLFAID